MDIKIGAAYIRVSSDDQLEYSPDSQLKVIRDHAIRDGYIIPDEYVFQDDGISGKSASKRPAFRLMIATAKTDNPPFDAIFVWKYSRFARNQEEAIMYKNLLKKRGISVRSISEPSTDSPFSSLIERIIEWMDEYYLINLSSEVRRGMTEKAARGEVMGTAPFGYTAKDKVFVPNEHADTVRYIFSEYLSGKGDRKIAAELGEKGVRTRRGNPPDNRWVHYILTNPTYIGKIRWSTEGHANYGRTNYSEENVMVVDGKHEPIIDMETWDAVQARISSRSTEVKYKRKDSNRMYMLKGLVRCGSCGATLTFLSTKSPSLQCHKYAKGQCHVSHCITVPKANATVIAAMEYAVEHKCFTFLPKPPKKGRIVHEWDRLIAAEQRKLERAKEAMLEGAFDISEYKAVRAIVEDNIEKLKAGQSAEASEIFEEIDPDMYAKDVEKVIEFVKSPDISEESKNEALRSVIEKVVFDKASGRFDIFFAR